MDVLMKNGQNELERNRKKTIDLFAKNCGEEDGTCADKKYNCNIFNGCQLQA